MQVRHERDRQALVGLVECARPLCLPRESQIVFVAVDDGAWRARAVHSQIHEVQAVVRVESNIGHEKVEGSVADSGARRFETTMTLDVGEGRRRHLQYIPCRLVGLDKQNVRR